MGGRGRFEADMVSATKKLTGKALHGLRWIRRRSANEVQHCLECGEPVRLGDDCDRRICAQRPHRVLERGSRAVEERP